MSCYTGPYYLGPAHPMMADAEADVPDIFYGYYFYLAEAGEDEGIKKHPTFVRTPTGGPHRPAFEKFYRKMEACLGRAVDQIERAKPLVAERHLTMFMAEESPIRWFYHIARTQGNFYESCRIRDRLAELADVSDLTAEQRREAGQLHARWREVLLDEKANAEAALPVMENDPRLNFKYGGDHSFEDGPSMIRAKLELLDHEIEEYLPSIVARLGLE